MGKYETERRLNLNLFSTLHNLKTFGKIQNYANATQVTGHDVTLQTQPVIQGHDKRTI